MTAYSGEPGPREPWDAWFGGGYTEEEKSKRKMLQQEALVYWQHHAFIEDEKEFPVIKGTEQPYNVELLNQRVPKKDIYNVV